MMAVTTDGLPPRARWFPPEVSDWKLRAFLNAAKSDIRQYQADSLGESWIRDLRTGIHNPSKKG